MTEPRDRFDLVPDAAAEAEFLYALEGGRLHHGWLLAGAEGMGKATFAYRAARRLLGAQPDSARGPLGARPDDPVSRLAAAGSHPDLLVLERAIEGGRRKKSISVDQARQLPEFFSKSPSKAPYRVAIIDAADDLNVNAANALLKVLEEPPERGVLLLVAHSPGRLLPTIRSRCRRLWFRPWTVEALAALVRREADLNADEAAAVAARAGGSPGAALALADAGARELDRLARSWVEGDVDRTDLISIADKFRGADGQVRFEAVMDRLMAAVKEQAAAGQGARHGASWAELWSRLGEAAERAAALNLDRGDMLTAAVTDLQRTKAAA